MENAGQKTALKYRQFTN